MWICSKIYNRDSQQQMSEISHEVIDILEI